MAPKGPLFVDESGAKRIEESIRVTETLSSNAPGTNDYEDEFDGIKVLLTERIPYETSGSSDCKRAQYKGFQVFLDDSIDDGAGFIFKDLEDDGIKFDSEDDDTADNLIHMTDHSFLLQLTGPNPYV